MHLRSKLATHDSLDCLHLAIQCEAYHMMQLLLRQDLVRVQGYNGNLGLDGKNLTGTKVLSAVGALSATLIFTC